MRRGLLLFGLFLLLPACKSTCKIAFDGDPEMNKTSGNPSPVRLKVMLLKKDSAFLSVDPGALWKDPKKELADQLTRDAREVTITPGSVHTDKKGDTNVVRFEGLGADEAMVGIIARFYETSGENRLLRPIADFGSGVVVIKDYGIDLVSEGKARSAAKASAKPADKPADKPAGGS